MASNQEKQFDINSPNENLSLSISQFRKLLRTHAEWLSISEQTSRHLHLSQLHSLPRLNSVTTVLLGDDILSHLKTAFKIPALSSSWPPASLLPNSTLNRLKATAPLLARGRLDAVFNASSPGEKVVNTLYRLAGDKSRSLDGLLPELAGHNIQLFVLHVGSNDLDPVDGLSAASLAHLRLLLQALLRICRAETKILVTGLLYRKAGVPDEVVDGANADVQNLLEGVNERIGARRIVFLDPPPVGKERVMAVGESGQLSLEGWRLWMETLVPRMAELLREVELLRKASRAIHAHAEERLLHSLRTGGKNDVL